MTTRAASPSANSSTRQQRPRRPREMQDALNHYLYHPLAWQLARQLARTPITPNVVSVIGGLMVVAAGFAYWGLAWPLGPLLGMTLHMTWHVVDGADGDLARVTGKSSPLGEMVDGICDYVSHIVLYVLLAVVLTRAIGPGWAWFWALAAGFSHIIQSNHVEVQRRFYQYWTYGVPWLHHAKGAQAGLFNDRRGGARVLQAIASAYLRLASGMSPQALRIDAAVTDAMTAAATATGTAAGTGTDSGDAAPRLAAIRAEVQREQRPLLDLLKLLGPNPRAIVLGLSMLAGSPLYYFLYQTVVLNGLLAVSVVLHNAAARRTAVRLERAGIA